jgi:KRAB domain-containing zinc finger protein
MQVMWVTSQLLTKDTQMGVGFNVLFGAMCVISRSAAGTVWSYTSLHIMESTAILAICVGNSSCYWVIWIYINALTVESVHFLVVCVYKSFTRLDCGQTHLHTRSGERTFSCHVCKRSFKFWESMIQHLRTHSYEHPFACNVCKKSFSQRSTARYNLRTHTDERPFSCNVCKKSFKWQTVLKRSIHSGECPFPCDLRKKCFPTSEWCEEASTHSYWRVSIFMWRM